MLKTRSKYEYAVVHFIESRPTVSLVFGLLLFLGMLTGLGKLSTDFSYKSLFYEDDPARQRMEYFEAQFGSDRFFAIAVESPSGIFDESSAKLINDLTKKIWQIPEVSRVDSLSTYKWVHSQNDDIVIENLLPENPDEKVLLERKQVALSHEIVPNYLISKDATIAMIYGIINPEFEQKVESTKIIPPVYKLLDEFKSGDHRFYLTGNTAVNYNFKEIARRDTVLLLPITILIIAIMLTATLRSIVGLMLSLVVVFSSCISSFGLMGVLGLDITNSTIAIGQIIIAIAVADSVHVLSYFVRAMRRGSDRKQAITESLLHNIRPTVITTISTSIGFFSFGTSGIKAIAGLGVVAGIATFQAWIYTFFIMAPLIYLLPIKIKAQGDSKLKSWDRFSDFMVERIVQYKMAIITVMSLLALSSLYLAIQNEVNADTYKYLSSDVPIRKSAEYINDKLGGTRSMELMIYAGKEEGVKEPEFLTKVEELSLLLEDNPKISRVLSIVDILKQTHRSLHGDDPDEYRLGSNQEIIAQELFLYTLSLQEGMSLNDRVSIKNDSMRMTVFHSYSDSKDITRLAREIETKAAVLGLDLKSTGKGLMWNKVNEKVVTGFIVSIVIAMVLISVLLMLVYKSFHLGLLAMIPNIAPLMFGGGILMILGKSLDIGTVIVWAFCLGVAVDDTIHILSGYKGSLKEGKSHRDALKDIYRVTSPALISTSAILVLGFGVFGFAQFVPNMMFGVLSALVMLIALFTDLTLLPAILSTDYFKEKLSRS